MRARKQKLVTRESLQAMLMTAEPEKVQHIIGRALIAIFDRQTRDEQRANGTNEHNNIGFTGHDGRSGSLTAKFYLKNGYLLDWQVEQWTKTTRTGFPRICKYSRQLNEIALEKLAKKVAVSQAQLPVTSNE